VIWQSNVVRGLNSKEKQWQINRLLLVASWFSIPRDLVDTLFVNHQYSQYHVSTWSALSLIIFVPVTLWILFASSRWLQKLSALLLAICCLTALYTRNLSLESVDNQHLLKSLILAWVVAVVISLTDWLLFQRFQQASRSNIDALPTLDVFSGPIDSPEDRARSQTLTRLREQARAEGLDLTDIDWMMIDYSRIAPVNAARSLEKAFDSTQDYWAFKQKIILLLENAIREDTERDVAAIKNYKRLKQDLRKGRRDQQLVAYLAPAILGARSQVQKALEFSIYAVIGCGVVAALVVIAAHYK
jgi:hypothetical protein